MGKSELHRRDFMKYTGIGLSGMAIPGLAMGYKKGLAGVASKSFQAIYGSTGLSKTSRIPMDDRSPDA